MLSPFVRRPVRRRTPLPDIVETGLMNAIDPATKLALTKFAVGQPVPRTEDPVLLTGQGRYTDDISLEGQVYAVMVRSRYAHGILRSVSTEAARAMPGVLGVWTGADLAAAGYGGMRCLMPQKGRDGTPMLQPVRPALAIDKVRFVGDPYAFVVAETALAAKDAAEAVEADIDPLPAVTRASEAAAPGAPLVYDDVPGNVAIDFHYGDAAKVASAFAAAAHVVKLPLVNSRIVVCAMEPRAAIASYDKASGRWTIDVGSQGVFGLRNEIAEGVLKVPRDKVRVRTGNVGGSFGMKAQVYPEYVCLFHAARELGRPVKWTDERSESFVSDQHGRDDEVVGELALDKDGNFLALRITGYGNTGAYLPQVGPLMHTVNVVKNSVGVYRTPAMEVAVKAVFTNTTPVGPYRGAGRPEGNYYMERLIDRAAAVTGIDRVELRRRNHIRPEEMPWAAPSGMNYDSGEFTALLDKALALADWDGFPARRAESTKKGRLRGRGIGAFLEVTAPPMKEMGGIRFGADGTVTIVTGTLDYGQGHATPFAQVLCDRLGVPFEAVRLVQGDSDQLVAGGGTGGSKSLMASGAAIVEASVKVVDAGRKIAAVALEAAEADIEFAQGRFTIAGTDRSIGIMELAAKLRGGLKLPDGVPATLDVTHVFEAAPSAFPNGCHVAEVEVDPETGVVDVVRYTAVNDFGNVVNPLLVEGQVHGGVVQGIGQALMESVRYDEHGSILTGSYMDYALPRAADVPGFVFATHAVPAKTNLLGAKGCGEAGCAGALPSVMNALVDALSELGIASIDMPATPARVWEAIRAARA
jgi:carbon-monoxide dehydrogenase large subunit